MGNDKKTILCIPLIPFDNRIKIAWDLLMVFAVFVSGLIIPYRMVSGIDPADLLYWLITVIFAIDIIINFNTQVRNGLDVHLDRRSVVKHYISTWFTIDLLATLPFAPIAQLISPHDISGSTLFKILMMLRLLRLLKLVKISTIFKTLQDLVSLSPALMRLIIFFFWFILVAHFMALGWIAIGASEQARSFTDQYIRALYWCVTTIATIGYGDYYPNHDSNIQIIYTIVVQLIGVAMFGYIIGNVATLIVNMDTARAEFAGKLEEMRNYMRVKKIPTKIQDKVKNYYNYLWETRKGITKVDFLDDLPKTLQIEISLYLNRSILEKVPLFKGENEVFVHEVIQELQPLVFLPGDLIIRQGEFGDCMYFLSSGDVEVLVNEVQVAKLVEGSPFGEAALIQGEKRNASIRALTYCDVYKLSKRSFDDLRREYPEFDRKVLEIVERRQKETAEKMGKGV